MELATVVILVREEGSAEKGGRGGGRSHVQNRRRQKVRELHIVVKLLLLKIFNFLAKIVKILLQKKSTFYCNNSKFYCKKSKFCCKLLNSKKY